MIGLEAPSPVQLRPRSFVRHRMESCVTALRRRKRLQNQVPKVCSLTCLLAHGSFRFTLYCMLVKMTQTRNSRRPSGFPFSALPRYLAYGTTVYLTGRFFTHRILNGLRRSSDIAEPVSAVINVNTSHLTSLVFFLLPLNTTPS